VRSLWSAIAAASKASVPRCRARPPPPGLPVPLRGVRQAIFEYTNETWKTPLTEQRFGLYELQAQAAPFTGRTTAAASDPVDTRAARPQHTAVVDNY
jgi:hypothetical protein